MTVPSEKFCKRDRLDADALGAGEDRVLIGAADHVGAAADQRLQRARAALEIVDVDLEPFLLEQAEAVRRW